MLPALPGCDSSSVSITDMETATNLSIGHTFRSKLADLYHLLFGNFGHAVNFATSDTANAASLRVHIVNVVSRRTSEQMLWIAAGRVIAMMADKMTGWYRTISQLIGNAVGAKGLLVSRACFAIASIIDIPHPGPALIRSAYVNSLPKLLWHRDNLTFVTTAKFLGLPLDATEPLVAGSRQGGRLTTTAGAKSDGGWRSVKAILASAMPANEPRWLTFLQTAPRSILGIDVGALTTATLAKAKRNFLFHDPCLHFRTIYHTVGNVANNGMVVGSKEL